MSTAILKTECQRARIYYSTVYWIGYVSMQCKGASSPSTTTDTDKCVCCILTAATPNSSVHSFWSTWMKLATNGAEHAASYGDYGHQAETSDLQC